jgi:hypothetical protein
MERRNRLKTKRKSKIDNVQIRENIRALLQIKSARRSARKIFKIAPVAGQDSRQLRGAARRT